MADKNKMDEGLLNKFLNGQLNEEERLELIKLINADPENEVLLFQLKDLYDAGNWETLKNEANTSNEWIKLKNKLRIDNVKQSKPYPINKIIFRDLMKYAAVFLLSIALTIFIQYLLQPKNNNNFVFQTNTGIGERSQVLLPDGTKVWLNTSSSLEYSNFQGSKIRKVRLLGEAFFEVVKDKSKPFMVYTKDSIYVKVTGTKFNVSAYSNDEDVRTVLVEGSVNVVNQKTGSSANLLPGLIAICEKSGNIDVQHADVALYTSWRRGEIRFDNMQFEVLAKQLERNYKVNFVFRNEKLKSKKFSGVFQYDKPIELILKVISLNTRFRFEIIKDTIIIK